MLPTPVAGRSGAPSRLPIHRPRQAAATGTPGRFADLIADLLSRGHGVRFRASGGSMHPVIRHGDLITVRPVAPESLSPGSIVLYQRGHRVLAHRLVGVQTDGGEWFRLVLCGDAMDTCDALVTLAQVLGKVVHIHRSGLLQNPRGASASLRRVLRVGAWRAGRLVACGLASVAERWKK